MTALASASPPATDKALRWAAKEGRPWEAPCFGTRFGGLAGKQIFGLDYVVRLVRRRSTSRQH